MFLSRKVTKLAKNDRGTPDQQISYLVAIALTTFTFSLWFVPQAKATRLPENLKAVVSKQFPSVNLRIDGSFETKAKELYLPLMLSNTDPSRKIELEAVFPDKTNPIWLFFTNGWCYVKTEKKEQWLTVTVPENMPENFKKAIGKLHFVPDLIVPDNFALPEDLKSLAGEVHIATLDDGKSASKSDAETAKTPGHGARGAIFVLSPGIGKITCLEEDSYKKIAELPTEGTPSGIAYAQGKLYIADQSKNRVLKLDPRHCQFLGQIDLPKHSAPKGIVALPDGKLFYVSESATSSIAVYEVANDHLLVRTKVLTGPSRMAITPNGTILLALNVPAGAVSIVSTQNQKFIGSVKVGSMPNAIVINRKSDRAYISNRVSNTVSVIDIIKHTSLQTIPTGTAPTGLALDADETRLFIANAKDNTISVFDLKANKKLDDIKLPIEVDFPGGLTLLPDKNHILVSSEVTDTIGILDTTTLKFEQQQIGYVSEESIWVPFL